MHFKKNKPKFSFLLIVFFSIPVLSFCSDSEEDITHVDIYEPELDGYETEEEVINCPKAGTLDDFFLGNILVIGGITKNDPEKLSVNIKEHCDLHGSGWDVGFVSGFTEEKYDHILFEHVGMSLSRVNNMGEPVDAEALAKAYFRLLKPGGSLDFLTWGSIRLCIEEKSINDLLLGPLFCCYDGKAHNLGVVAWNQQEQVFHLTDDSYPFSDPEEAVLKDNLLCALQKEPIIQESVLALVKAGFQNITLRTEKSGILGFTSSHSSLHISAKKPKTI